MLGQVLGTNGNVPFAKKLERVLVYSEMTSVNLILALYLRYLSGYDFEEHRSGLIIIIIIMSLFYEDNIFSTITNLTYGPRLKKQQKHDNHNTIFTIYT